MRIEGNLWKASVIFLSYMHKFTIPKVYQKAIPCEQKGAPVWPTPKERDARIIITNNSLHDKEK